MFNSAKQEGSTASALIIFYGLGSFIAWVLGEYFGVIDTQNAGSSPTPGFSAMEEDAKLDGWVFWAITALFTLGATVNCIYGMSGFNVGPRILSRGPSYSVLAGTSE